MPSDKCNPITANAHFTSLQYCYLNMLYSFSTNMINKRKELKRVLGKDLSSVHTHNLQQLCIDDYSKKFQILDDFMATVSAHGGLVWYMPLWMYHI